ncbi:LPS assembly lipoprotein LptE [Psychromonas aquimarina]|uniref:LPS-assembly lipoprotein LptE n=1 Tax=Psychromonas aquimarina TaxID=444919 RepID=UPI0004188BD6|nr:LPS assembly lipoprotein LptE [Psychromonas aquimarina]
MFPLSNRAFYIKAVFLFLSITFISGCGFHLKHNDGLAEKYPQIYIQSSDPNGELTRLVKLRLRGAGIEVLSLPQEDAPVLRIMGEQRTTRTISLYVNATNAEQELGYNLNYSIQNPGYEVQSFTVNLYRDFLDNPAQALAKSREAELLTKELRGIAADHIIATMLSLKNEKSE